MESGTLYIEVVAGRNVSPKEIDSMCKVYLVDEKRTLIKNLKHKTKIAKKSTQPEWGETFEFFTDDRVSGAIIELSSKGTFKKSVLGNIFIPAEELKTQDEKENWFILYKGEKQEPGDIFLRYRFEKRNKATEESLTVSQIESAKKLQKVFNMPPDEKVLEKVNCAFNGKIPIQGTMYITRHHLFFNSLGKKIKIRLSNIRNVEKKSAALMLPTGLRLILNDEREFTFSNIFNREKIAVLIMERARVFDDMDTDTRSDATGEAIDEISETSSVDESFGSFTEGEKSKEVSSGKSEQKLLETKVSRQLSSSSNGPHLDSAQSNGSSESKLTISVTPDPQPVKEQPTSISSQNLTPDRLSVPVVQRPRSAEKRLEKSPSFEKPTIVEKPAVVQEKPLIVEKPAVIEKANPVIKPLERSGKIEIIKPDVKGESPTGLRTRTTTSSQKQILQEPTKATIATIEKKSSFGSSFVRFAKQLLAMVIFLSMPIYLLPGVETDLYNMFLWTIVTSFQMLFFDPVKKSELFLSFVRGNPSEKETGFLYSIAQITLVLLFSTMISALSTYLISEFSINIFSGWAVVAVLTSLSVVIVQYLWDKND